ncbi:MAG: hypothetical protein H7X80_01545, partial [bacterium]|nr:hypothetical protein [Candidatus Kapabacteria bacterium]
MFVRHSVALLLFVAAGVLAIVHPAVVEAQPVSASRKAGDAPSIVRIPLWLRLGELSSARSNVGAVYIGSGRILAIGGSTGIPQPNDPQAIPQSTCEIIDVWKRTITPAASMLLPR